MKFRMTRVAWGCLCIGRSGQISVGIPGIASVIRHVQSGRLHALGVTGAKRSAQLPNVPTIAEGGVKGYDADQWLGFIAPAKMWKEAIARLHAELKKQFSNVGAESGYLGPEKFGALIRIELPKWARVVQATRMEIN